MKVLGKPTGKLDVKRFKINGTFLMGKCPKCKTEIIEDAYLEYPVVNSSFEYNFYCVDCSHEWSETMILKIELKKVRGVL